MGLALVVAGAAGWGATPRWSDVGAATAQRLAQPQGTPETYVPGGGMPVPVIRGNPAPARPVVAPVSLRIGAIDVKAVVVPIGVDARTGLVAVPPDVRTLGWYRLGEGLDANAGSVVIVGHVDDYRQGPGAFFRLGRVSVGDEVVVRGADGRDRVYRVVSRERLVKQRLPVDRLFGNDGAPRLTLITCGGAFDKRDRSYLDNVVVTAVPTRSPRR